MRLRALLLALALALLAAPLAPQQRPPSAPAPTAAKAPEVVDIDFPGARSLDKSLLESAIETEETHCRSPLLFWACAFGAGWAERRATLDTARVRGDVERLRKLYADWGYPQARVGSEIVPSGRNEVEVRFPVEEGRPTLVRSVRVVGLDSLPNPPRLPTLPLRPGRPYALPLLELSQRLITGRLADIGHPFATVEVGGNVASAGGAADVVLTVHPGRLGVFDSTTIEAQAPIEENEIRERLAYRPGERFSTKALRRTHELIADLPIVQEATIEPSGVVGDSAVAIHVAVKATRRTGVQAEGTVSAASCLQLQTTAADRYFLGRPRVVSATVGVGNLLAGSLGGFPCTGENAGFTKPAYFVTGDWREPVAPATWLLFSGTYVRQVQPPAFVREAAEARLGVSHRFPSGLDAALAYAPSRTRNLEEGSFLCAVWGACGPDAAPFADRWTTLAPGELSLALLPRLRAPYPEGPIRGLAASLPYSRTRGSLQLTSSAAGTPTLSDWSFGRSLLLATVTHRTGPRIELAARARVGGLGGDDTLPPQLRFYGGGPAGVRGVQANLLGRRLLVTSRRNALDFGCAIETGGCPGGTEVDPDKVDVQPAGGTFLLETSAEARTWISARVQLAAFVDYGFVRGGVPADAPVAAVSAAALATPGIGIRVLSPFGPLRLDVAYDPRHAQDLPLVVPDSLSPGDLFLGLVRYDPYGHGNPSGFTRFRRHLQLQFTAGQIGF
ncbi:MAG TPA: BamA/TamA family outer membrane protein [Longimicrobiales bacterium]|nr:BamA/TamA family outer membrane protein [Longimicrobiales bacterium]